MRRNKSIGEGIGILMIMMAWSIAGSAMAAPQDSPFGASGNLLPPGALAPPAGPVTGAQDSGVTNQQPAPLPGSLPKVDFVEERFTGWQQVSLDPERRLDEQLRSHWVMIDDEGTLRGQILGSVLVPPEPSGEAARAGEPPLAEAGDSLAPQPPGSPDELRIPPPRSFFVYLLNQGRPVNSTEVDADGRFTLRGLKPGTYSLIGYGHRGFFAFSLNVVPRVDLKQEPTELKIEPMALYGMPVTSWIASAAPGIRFRIIGQQRFGESRDDPPRLYGIAGLSSFSPTAIPATSIVGHPVALTLDGRLLGRVHNLHGLNGRPIDLQSSTVRLMQDGKTVHEVGTDNYGVFEFENVAAGSYDVAVFGPDGVAALRIRAVSGEGETLPLDLAVAGSDSIGWLNHYMSETAYWSVINAPRPPSQDGSRCSQCGGGVCPQCGGCHCAEHSCGCGWSEPQSISYGWVDDP